LASNSTRREPDSGLRQLLPRGHGSKGGVQDHDEDVTKFAVPRLSLGIRWWEDVIKYNDNSHLYPKEFIEANPPKW
jgi:hypothetical protein